MADLIPATDLKQWAYCQRIPFYHRVQGLYPPMTGKMKEALNAQEQFEKLEVRRRLEKYGLANARREFDVWLESAELGISGRVDLLVTNDERASVVDFKLTAGEPGENHRLQLGAYGMMTEERTERLVEQVFLYRIPDDRLFPIELTDALREQVNAAVAGIRNLEATESCPPPTSIRAKCAECEYANFCADVW
jgi:CRISPR-associated exonuclease Cas4